MKPVWTNDRVEIAAGMWRKGESANAIRRKLDCGFTRNAVLGKMHRMGIERPEGASMPARANRGFRKPPKEGAAKVLKSPLHEARVLPMKGRTGDSPAVQPVLDLGPYDCKFPIGDPQREGFKFCAAPQAEGKTYCPEHCRVVFTPLTGKRAGISRSYRALA